MTPDQIKVIFDPWAVTLAMFAGIAIKYLPWLRKVSNDAIGWINLAGYILSSVFVGVANAGLKDVIPDAGSVLVSGLTNAGWAMILYESFGRTLLEKWLKIKKAQ